MKKAVFYVAVVVFFATLKRKQLFGESKSHGFPVWSGLLV